MLEVVSLTGAAPVTSSEVAAHLRLDAGSLEGDPYLAAAIDHVQQVTGRLLTAGTYRLTVDKFPSRIPYAPLTSVTSVEYTALDGSTQTVAPADYIVDLQGGRIAPAWAKYWPAVQPVLNAVRVTFEGGYAELPESIRAAILLVAGDLYANREGGFPGQPYQRNPAVDALLYPYRVFG